MSDELDAPKNREQRRAERHRRATDQRQDNLQPQSANNPTFNRSDELANPAFGEGKHAIAGRPDQDQTALTGPGTGGATESGDRLPEHPAQNPRQNQPNS
jgi:hypothetical protein